MARIHIKRLQIDFPIYGATHRSLKKSLLNLGTGGKISTLSEKITVVKALDDISLDVKAGCRLGLLGHNGSGKSTLLKVLAGVYLPTGGQVCVEGQVAALLDISLGMDDEESGLGEYLHLPIRTYSTGMRMRLGFAISTSIEADILLMDEWLSVGDAEF